MTPRRDTPAAFVFILTAAAALLLLAAAGSAEANLLQLVSANFTPGALGSPASDEDAVFVPTSADVTTDIFASVGQAPPGGPGYVATAGAGRFGQVGLDARIFSVGPGSQLFADVLIGSDKFVNLLGVPVAVSSHFIIDGGLIWDFFSTNTSTTFTLEFGAENLGPVGRETIDGRMVVATRVLASLGATGFLRPGGGSIASLTSDGDGTQTLTESVTGGLDLGVTVDPTTGFIEIPLSFQSFDLGVLNPGDRLLLAYRVAIDIRQDGLSEGIRVEFSDPFSLSGSSILSSLTFTPLADPPGPPSPSVSEPAAGLLFAFGVGAAAKARRRRIILSGRSDTCR